MQPSRDLTRLVEIMRALRDPVSGCPWDLEQDFSSIRHYTIEEAYEVADAIEREDFADLEDELGDLLLQPVYHAQMASERGLFDIGDVILAITTKLVRRHPHVFGDQSARDAGAAKARWDDIKATERQNKPRPVADTPASLLDDVPMVLPALARSQKLDKKAARAGFDWPDAETVLAKCREELDEIEGAQAAGDKAAVKEEIGDMLLAVATLARFLDVDAEAALRDANLKFTRRFQHVEARCAADGLSVETAGMEKLDQYWNEVRAADKSGG